MPITLLSIFQGNLSRNFSNKDFMDSTNPQVMKLKNIVLKSARLAFHFSLESAFMGEFYDLPEFHDFEVSVL